MSITSVVNDLVTSVSVINALKPLPPTITSYSVGGLDDTALDPAGGQTVQINGTGFLPGATITFDGSAVAVVTYVSPNQLTFTSPAKSAGTYTIYAVNPDGGTAIFIPGIIYSVLPTWTTSAGTLGSYYETTSISNTVVASGDAPITYSLFSGSLPTGSTLYANGVITGTAPIDSSSTTYSFTIQATDAQLQDSTRSFSLTINTDAVTWVSPANNTTYTSAVDSAIANVTLSATDAAGYAVSYSANALPTGLSLSGANISGTPTVIADSSTLLTATAATTNRTAVRTINWSITVANDPYFEYNTLLIPGASTTFVDDASTNNFAVTINGDTKPNNFNPYTPGYYSNYFDGLGDWLTIPNNTGFAFGSGAFTVEMWVNISGSSGTVANYSNGQSSNSNFSWELYQVSSTTIQFSVLEGATQYSSSSASFSLNKWNHIACVRNGNTLTIYVNGVAGGTTANLTGVTVTEPAGSTLKLCSYGNGSDYVTGYISNFRVVKGTAVYTTTFTPSTTPLTAISGTSVLTCQSNRFIDNSTNNFTLTVYGNTSINSFDPFTPNTGYSGYGSTYFDGTGDYLSVPYNSALALGSVNTWTIEYWVYFNASLGTYTPISHQQDPTVRWCVEHNASTTLLLFDNSTGTTFTNPSTLAPNTWYHIAFVRDGTTVRMYINGAVSVTTTTSNLSNITSGPLSIGRNEFGGAYFFYMNGYIADVRLVKGTAVYTTTFTPPSAPLTAIANTSLLTLQNNQPVNNSTFLDNSTNNFLVTRAGNTTQGTFSPYGGNWSNYFNGSSDYLTVPSNSAFAFGTGDFTVEMWVYHIGNAPNGGVNTDRFLFGGFTTSPACVFFLTNNALNLALWDGTTQWTSAGSVTPNTWNHIAYSRVGTNLYYAINGVVAVSTGFSTNFTVSRVNYIGRNDTAANRYFPGYISNLRVIKGTGLYTSNFTPSTTPLTVISGTSLLTCQSNRLIDNSINNFTITKGGDTSVQRFSPFNPASVTPTSYSGYFDGTGDYLTVPNNAVFDFSTGDFTVEAWVYTNSTQSQYANIVCQGSTAANAWYLSFGTSNTVTFSNFSTSFLVSSSGVANNTWTHVAVSRSGTSLTMFFNGVQVASATNSSTLGATATLFVGFNNGASYFNGSISNLRIVKGTALYTTTFTPSTTPLTTTSQGATASQVSLLTLQSTTFIDNSTNNFTITAFGNSQPTIQNPFGYTSALTNGYTPSTIGGSGYFDGTGDYLSTPSLISASGDFTLECWFNTTIAVSGFRMLCGGNIDASASDYLGINASGVEAQFGTGSATVVTAAYTFVPNTWYHVAMTRSGTTVKVFVNGVSLTTSQGTQSGTFSIRYIAIGYNGITYTGYIADLRFVVGTSIYNSNFVPPAAPLTAVQNTVLLNNMTSAGIYDAAMMNNMETVGDAKLSTAVTKFGSSSMYFDGSGDHLYIPNAPVNQLGTENYTIEFWIYGNSWSTLPVILEYGRSTNNASAGLEFYVSTGGGKLDIYGGASTATLLASYSSLSTATWTHIALTRASNTTRLFINGTQSGSSATDSTNYNQSSILVGIFIGSTNPLNGYIDDFRITKGYARYTSNFTPPTSAFQLF